MALVLENFQTQIHGKFFVSIESISEVLEFTSLEQSGIDLRNAATTEKVIVFLPPIQKLFARGSYYGISNEDISEMSSDLSELQSLVSTLGGSLSELAGIVHTQGNSITDNTSAITALTQLVGNNVGENDQPIITNANGIIGTIKQLQQSISALSPGGQDLSELVAEAVEDALENELETALGSSATITSINQSITTINNELTTKAEKSAFDEVVRKLGSGSWTWIEPTPENPNPNNTTIVDALNTVIQNVSQIPHFGIQIVDGNANGLPNVEQNNISNTTIYLVRPASGADPSNNEIFTEYIYVNLDANKVDENDNPLPERWGWETLGRQYFNISNYLELSNEDFERIKSEIETAIQDIQTQLGDADTAQIAINKSNIETLQTNLQNLENNIATYITNQAGDLLVTGSHIKTSDAQNSDYIANDIVSLKANKMDKDSLQWIIINENS